ncbi:hypothetical protein EDB87DRAFT_796045 [Lactarius vividus]|nr:hypothetical protein EDB87DRAFT_796045 [Lactarius vividus]
MKLATEDSKRSYATNFNTTSQWAAADSDLRIWASSERLSKSLSHLYKNRDLLLYPTTRHFLLAPYPDQVQHVPTPQCHILRSSRRNFRTYAMPLVLIHAQSRPRSRGKVPYATHCLHCVVYEDALVSRNRPFPVCKHTDLYCMPTRYLDFRDPGTHGPPQTIPATPLPLFRPPSPSDSVPSNASALNFLLSLRNFGTYTASLSPIRCNLEHFPSDSLSPNLWLHPMSLAASLCYSVQIPRRPQYRTSFADERV